MIEKLRICCGSGIWRAELNTNGARCHPGKLPPWHEGESLAAVAAVDANALVEDDPEDSDAAGDEGVESDGVRHHSAPQKVDGDSGGEDDPDRRSAPLRV